jgi:hypothetical protein
MASNSIAPARVEAADAEAAIVKFDIEPEHHAWRRAGS